MKKRGLAILIAVLGVLCVVCGALLLQGNSTPVTACLLYTSRCV